MALYRYLLNFSYIGKMFRGAQRQVRATIPRQDDPSTVQGCLEIALKELNPCNEPIIVLSSRTDAGVHAMHSTCHVDLYRRNGLIYKPRTVTICLNRYFKKNDLPIRVLQTYIVPEDFHSRHSALSRTYLYRICLVKGHDINLAAHWEHIPIEEIDRCFFIFNTENFDVDKMKEAAQLFQGLHDFRSFMGTGAKDPDKMTRKYISKVEVVAAKPTTYCNYSIPSCVAINAEDYEYYDIYITGDGFLYRQVRRTVASLIAAAQGKVTTRDIKLMLQVPSHNSWNPKLQTVPAWGLYLCQVSYSEEDTSRFKEDVQ